jgi:hypothetical protein
MDEEGNLYGTTTGGGDPTCRCEVVFKVTPKDDLTSAFLVLVVGTVQLIGGGSNSVFSSVASSIGQ